MRIEPLIQAKLFDVSDWEPDAEFAVYPQGARAKDAVFAPSQPNDFVIVPHKRYLFKRSNKRYQDQFWGEIVAYRVGCLMGLKVPPAFAAWNSETGICAALIEWFYLDDEWTFYLGGDLLEKLYPEFDRKLGKMHNIEHIAELMEVLVHREFMEDVWKQWLVNLLLFDALIGNTDRHQDNWGLLNSSLNLHYPIKLSPYFDNGTSLGHERFPEQFNQWNANQIIDYITNKKAKHHVKWSLTDAIPIQGHFDLLKKILTEWPETQLKAKECLNFTEGMLRDSVSDLTSLGGVVCLSHERIAFMLKLLFARHALLKSLF